LSSRQTMKSKRNGGIFESAALNEIPNCPKAVF
jgi:hypothetical protein